ncbi:recombinase family protein [Streptomyces sp. TRM66268-LWL]|uniref:Recombinase family protein n=1 Tax=Streptomyces polyasparticus TaxID=2767826 RepID=A0ABR7SU43_9ACTN|nr:recombinase family protein [Streptomyces polyasparticus]MBC9718996.1 recombinase family protein [Streptomyces polyasparticus]
MVNIETSETGTPTGYVYGYARVSTTAQDLTRQLDRLAAAGVPDERIYVDKKTGTDFEREGLADVLGQLRPGDVLMLDSLDRLGRTMHKMLSLAHELIEKGVFLVVLGGPIPFDTRNPGPQTDMAIAMLGFLSEVELIFQRERRASARASREARGGSWGRPVKGDRDAVLADFAAGMSAREVMTKHDISRATAFRIKATAQTETPSETPVVEHQDVTGGPTPDVRQDVDVQDASETYAASAADEDDEHENETAFGLWLPAALHSHLCEGDGLDGLTVKRHGNRYMLYATRVQHRDVLGLCRVLADGTKSERAAYARYAEAVAGS